MLILKNDTIQVGIDKGELTSLKLGEHQYIHQKGAPGWQHSDTEMFPIIGPTAEVGYRVHVPRGNAILDQHGLLREMDYELVEHSSTSARFRKTYTKGMVVANSKFPERSTAQRLIWPFDFQFEKYFELYEKELRIQFTVAGERDMPFMLGYHPAFKLYSDNPRIEAKERTVELEEIMDAGSKALELSDCERVVLKDLHALEISTEGFGHFMLWTEVPNMLCVEPITFYPYNAAQTELHEGFIHQEGEEMRFAIILKPQ
ncbi:MAG: aldose 1-epimerase [Flavobacteriaceae bacterium]